MRYILEFKRMYIVPEPLRKNRCCQSYRWKQYAMSDDKKAFEEFIARQRDPADWQITDRRPYEKQD